LGVGAAFGGLRNRRSTVRWKSHEAAIEAAIVNGATISRVGQRPRTPAR
jgi:hypothetical protein